VPCISLSSVIGGILPHKIKMTVHRTLSQKQASHSQFMFSKQAMHGHGWRLPSNTRAVPNARHERYKRHSRVGHIRCYDLRQGGRKGGREGGRERGKGKEGAARGWIGICQFGATAMASTDAATVPGRVAEADATNQSRVRMAVGPNTRFILSTSGRLSSMRRWCFVTSPAVSALCDTTL